MENLFELTRTITFLSNTERTYEYKFEMALPYNVTQNLQTIQLFKQQCFVRNLI